MHAYVYLHPQRVSVVNSNKVSNTSCVFFFSELTVLFMFINVVVLFNIHNTSLSGFAYLCHSLFCYTEFMLFVRMCIFNPLCYYIQMSHKSGVIGEFGYWQNMEK
jgi:hypothetical protein